MERMLQLEGFDPGLRDNKFTAKTADALKQFQAEQHIDSSGKINSLSLIALGLGPKHDPAAVKPPPPPGQ